MNNSLYFLLGVLFVRIIDSVVAYKFVSDLRHVGGFRRLLRFPPPLKLTTTI